MPGCLDQTIHADTSHIYTHIQLPGHYFNLFIPAIQSLNSGGEVLLKSGGEGAMLNSGGEGALLNSGGEGVLKNGGEGVLNNGGFDIGQTAFVCGSHHIQVSYDIMVGASGNVHLLDRLIRPHLQSGDALIFDCRILHLGLANRGQNYIICCSICMIYSVIYV